MSRSGCHCNVCKNADRLRAQRKRFAKYGLTLEQASVLLDKQQGKCAICLADFPPMTGDHFRVHVDHDHQTGIVRGILCNKCNMAVGLFNDDPTLLEKAAQYVKDGKVQTAQLVESLDRPQSL